MKQGKKIISIGLIIIFSFLYAHIDKKTELYDRNVESSDYIACVMTGTVEQDFFYQETAMDAVQIKIQTTGEISDEKLRLSLVESETGKIQAVSEQAICEIKSGKFNTFSFETIENCKGKNYKAVLEIVNIQENQNGNIIVYQQSDGTYIMQTVMKCFDIETFCMLLLLLFYIYGFLRFLYRLFAR